MAEPTLSELIEVGRQHVTTDAEREAQRRSFAYGNVKISNSDITREMIDRAADASADDAREGGQGRG